ncbi:MAG: hypothetical protein HC917_27720, partial [Richelia sp. SM2_1_7]|nr:hypothetical protein [Richelia sp. SM2_1_7]
GRVTDFQKETTTRCFFVNKHFNHRDSNDTKNPQKHNRRLVGKNKHAKRKNRRTFNKEKDNIDNNCIFNLSNINLNKHHIAVLNKGLNFSPSNYKPKPHQLDTDLLRFERTLQLRYFFNNDSYDNNRVFEKNPEWWPNKLNPLITKFCRELHAYLSKTLAKPTIHHNLNNKQQIALKQLIDNRNIVIKPADKGGGIVIMNKDMYLNKMNTLLNDTNTYDIITTDDTINVKTKAD